MAIDHYENFPVASILLPRRLREPVAAIYAFARSADDLADEGDHPAAYRLAALAEYDRQLDLIDAGGSPDHAMFRRLGQTIRVHALPMRYFHDLLSAFSQDVETHRYESFTLLLDYCRRSADPVGRLMLHLYGRTDETDLRAADAICSALQLANFWQDAAIDWQKGRIYLPLEDMRKHGVDEAHLRDAKVDDRWRALMAFQIRRTRHLMQQGAPLALRLPGRIGWELRLVVQGGLRIMEKIEAADFDVFRRRPVLNKCDWVLMVFRAARMHSGMGGAGKLG